MTPDTAALMASYNQWMNRRLYDAAARLSVEELHKDRGAFFGSLFRTMTHIAVGDTVWLHRFAEHPDALVLRKEIAAFAKPIALDQQLACDLPELDRYRSALDKIIMNWAATLNAEQLAAPLSYSTMAGKTMRKNCGQVVMHFFNHQTHHRGQASTLLYQAGIDIGMTDLLGVVPDNHEQT